MTRRDSVFCRHGPHGGQWGVQKTHPNMPFCAIFDPLSDKPSPVSPGWLDIYFSGSWGVRSPAETSQRLEKKGGWSLGRVPYKFNKTHLAGTFACLSLFVFVLLLFFLNLSTICARLTGSCPEKTCCKWSVSSHWQTQTSPSSSAASSPIASLNPPMEEA